MNGFSSLKGQCKLEGIYFVFSPTRKKTIETPTHIAHIAKAPPANAENKALSKSAIFANTHTAKLKLNLYF